MALLQNKVQRILEYRDLNFRDRVIDLLQIINNFNDMMVGHGPSVGNV